MTQTKPQKVYVFTIVVTKDNNSKEVIADSKATEENAAMQEYFKLERKCNSLKGEFKEVDLRFDVNNLEDSSLNVLERYNFFSKIQFEKDKQRLPFND
jgi:hypothetical protein